MPEDIEITLANPSVIAGIRAALGASDVTRTLRFPDGEVSPPSPVLPSAADRARRGVEFDGDGKPRARRFRSTTIAEATTARTLVLTDDGGYIRLTHASGCAITVPPQADVAWLDETEIQFRVAAAGAPSVTGGAGVTVNNAAAAAAMVQHQTFALKRVGLNQWDLI